MIVKLIIACLCSMFAWKQSIAQPLLFKKLSCEGRVNPLAVPLDHIHFSWQLQGLGRNRSQTFYQLKIWDSKNSLDKNQGAFYNSGLVNSDQSIEVAYQGPKFQPGKTYFWKIKVRDNKNQESDWSAVQQFTTGLFEETDWDGAKWIGYEQWPDSLLIKPGVPDADQLGNRGLRRPIIPCFRTEFKVSKRIVQALAYVTGLGQYEMTLNGVKVGRSFLSPGWTYYEKRTLYNVYDISPLLKTGVNAVGMMLGNGFYNINRERYYKLIDAFGTPKMICKISLTYSDGSTKSIISDQHWKMSESPIVFSSIYGGEDYDANLEQKGWNLPGFNDDSWKNALPVQGNPERLEPESDFPLQVMQTISPVRIMLHSPKATLYDFGQNASGIPELLVQGKKGDTVRLTPAELLDRNHMPNQNASGKPYYFTYILKGGPIEKWRPRFSYYGFRYVLAEVFPRGGKSDVSTTQLKSLTLLHTRNSAPATGRFTSSDSLFNKINRLIQWAIKSNLQSVVTDCPHREKLGWMEQDYLMGTSIQYNFNIRLLYSKLLADMRDAQTPEGLVPDIAPEFVVFEKGFRDSPEWGSAAVILPWLLYQWYGDKQAIADNYPMMKKYLDYLAKKSSGFILDYGLGDWYDYGPGFPGYAQLTPVALTATASFFYDAQLLSKMVGILNDLPEQKALADLAGRIRDAFNAKFFDSVRNVYSTGSQTAMAMPYCMGLVPINSRESVLKNLADSIKAGSWKLTAGDIGFHYLVSALDQGGRADIIYQMNHRDDVAGYGFQLKKGATALTESWAALEEVSNNHLMLGHVMEWFYSGIAGISQQEHSVAYKHLLIRPQPVGSIHSAKADFETPYGNVTTFWQKQKDVFKIQVSIPPNSDALLVLPAGKSSVIYEGGKPFKPLDLQTELGIVQFHVGSGRYYFEIR